MTTKDKEQSTKLKTKQVVKKGNELDQGNGAAKRSRRKRWAIRGLIAVVGSVIGYTLSGFYGVPWLVKGPILTRVAERVKGTVSIDKVTCNPYRFHVILTGIRVKDSKGIEVLRVGSADVNASLWRTLVRPGYQVQTAIVKDVYVRARVSPRGEIDLLSLIKPEPVLAGAKPRSTRQNNKPLRAIPRLIAEVCRVEEVELDLVHVIEESVTGEVRYETKVVQGAMLMDGIDLGPLAINVITLSGTTARGEKLGAELTFQAKPMALGIVARADGVLIEPLSAYAGPFGGLNVKVERGTADVVLRAKIDADAAKPEVTARIESLTARDVNIVYASGAHAGELIVDVARLDVHDAAADRYARSVNVAIIEVVGATAYARRDQQGRLNVAGLLLPRKFEMLAQPGVAGATKGVGADVARAMGRERFVFPVEAKTYEYPIERIAVLFDGLATQAQGGWSTYVGKVALTGCAAAWVDGFVRTGAQIAVSGADVELGPVSSSTRFELPIKAKATIASGTAIIEGVIKPSALSFEAKVKVVSVDASLAGMYLPAKLGPGLEGVDVTRAIVSADGTIQGKYTLADSTIEAQWEGRAAITDAKVSVTRVAHANGSGVDLVRAKLLQATGKLGARGKASDLVLNWNGVAVAEELGLDAVVAGAEVGIVGLRVRRAEVAGTVGATVGMAAGSTGTLSIGLVSDLGGSVTRIEANVPKVFETRATAVNVDFAGLVVDLARLNAKVTSIAVDSPSASLVMALLPSVPVDGAKQKEIVAADGASSAYYGLPVPGFGIEVGAIAIQNGSVAVRDTTTEPAMIVSLGRIDVNVNNFATREGAHTTVDLNAMLQYTGRLTVRGTLDAFRAVPNGDLNIVVASMPLHDFDSASGRFIGYTIDRGRTTLNLPVTLKEGALKGSLKINLDAFYVGKSVPSDEALDVPIELGLALLRDLNEQIDANIGIEGRIDDPDFSVTGLAWRAITNMFVKAATAPFQIIGAAFGALEGDDLSRAAFNPGTDQLDAASLVRLDVLAQAMKARPGLKLEMLAVPSTEVDELVLKRKALRGRMLDAAKNRDPRVLSLTQEIYERQVESAFLASAREIPEKQRAAFTAEQREKFMIEQTDIQPDVYLALASARVQAARNVLTNEGGVEASRITVVEATEEAKKGEAAEVRFELK